MQKHSHIKTQIRHNITARNEQLGKLLSGKPSAEIILISRKINKNSPQHNLCAHLLGYLLIQYAFPCKLPHSDARSHIGRTPANVRSSARRHATPTHNTDTQRRPRGNEHTAPRIKARKSSQNPTRQRLQKAHTTDCAETHIKKRVPRKLRTRKADRARFELAEVSLDGFQDRFFRPLRHLSGKSCAGRLSGPIPPHKN